MPTIIVHQPTRTTIPPTQTPTPIPPKLTITPQACDSSVADFCTTDGHFLLQRPIHPPGNTSVDVTYRYASTADGRRDPHTGVEFLNKFGTPVHAAGDGVVIFAGPDSQPIYSPWRDYYGNLVVVEHADGLYTLYAHLSKILVEHGQKIAAGEQIGEVGQTGVAIGSHLHFEVRRREVEAESSTENPELWLVPNQGEIGSPLGALQLSVIDQTGQLVETAEFTLEHHAIQSQAADFVYYETTYHEKMLTGEENAGIGDLPAGSYRILLLYNGNRYERWVEVESDKLTEAVIVVK
ncbi:MAG TPA: M23 family metallopeptidase [Anaerolineales bacterium]|nr:M23 family metallopeptidase [Anaerolineales bacterium]